MRRPLRGLFSIAPLLGLGLGACGQARPGTTDDAGTSPPRDTALLRDGRSPDRGSDGGACSNPLDLAGCGCSVAGATRSCYPGPIATLGKGVCHAGSQSCGGTGGLVWSTCVDAVTPSHELCNDGLDDDCNGLAACADPACATAQSCRDAGTPDASTTCRPVTCSGASFTVVPSGGSTFYQSIWGTSTTDIWFAGLNGISHWNGSAITSAGGSPAVTGVFASSPSDAWATGLAGLMMHWDGTGWTSVASGTTRDLNWVWGSGPSDVWAVGSLRTGSAAPGETIDHFDGSSWSVVPSPAPTTSGIGTIWGSSATDVWAGATGQILHWDGSSWRVASTSAPSVLSLFGTSSSDVWAGGEGAQLSHFDGTSWTLVSTPASALSDNNLWGVWAASPCDAWAVGGNGAGFIMHWDGTSWSLVAKGMPNGLFDVWGANPCEVWVAGLSGTILHYH